MSNCHLNNKKKLKIKRLSKKKSKTQINRINILKILGKNNLNKIQNQMKMKMSKFMRIINMEPVN